MAGNCEWHPVGEQPDKLDPKSLYRIHRKGTPEGYWEYYYYVCIRNKNRAPGKYAYEIFLSSTADMGTIISRTLKKGVFPM
ncbi:hypothetical protein CE91St56_06630 [Lachnospiraceae bacterium]|nr:hypothetical protein CE91St56_06630 [Lachnospiraceae bacterium]GKH45403.1 hypothetical protein CE91St57_63770 [Lachnospiraceae bacterium]